MIFQRIKHRKGSWLARLLQVEAITLYPYVFYRPKEPPLSLMYHELVHCQQVEDLGRFRFYVSYLFFYFAHRLMGMDQQEAYMAICYEREAYDRQWDYKEDESFMGYYAAEEKRLN